MMIKTIATVGTIANAVCLVMALNSGYDAFAVLGWAGATLWSLNVLVLSE